MRKILSNRRNWGWEGLSNRKPRSIWCKIHTPNNCLPCNLVSRTLKEWLKFQRLNNMRVGGDLRDQIQLSHFTIDETEWGLARLGDLAKNYPLLNNKKTHKNGQRIWTDISLLLRRYANCQQAHDKMLSITSHCMCTRFNHAWLCVILRTVACQVPLSKGFSRQEYWSGLPCPPPGDLPGPGIERWQVHSLPLAPSGKLH